MQTALCYDLDMSDPYTRKGVQAYSEAMRCVMIKGIGYVFIKRRMEITQDIALHIAELLAEIGPIPHDAKESSAKISGHAPTEDK
jgi:hypothetical protein